MRLNAMNFIFVFLTLILFSVIAKAETGETILLMWNDNPAGELINNYKVYQDDIVIAEPTASQHEIEKASAENSCFNISAVNVLGESEQSDSTCVPSDVPSAPSSPTIVNIHINVN